MAGMFQSAIVRWVLDGKRVKPNTPGAVQITEVSPMWTATWRDPDTGVERRCPLSKSKSRAIELLQEIEADLVRRRLGLPSPAPPLDGRPLLEHLEEYCGVLAAKGDVPTHVEAVRGHCQTLLVLLKWSRLKDVRPDGVLEALAGMRKDKVAELPPGQEEFTIAEAALALGIKEASVRASYRRKLLKIIPPTEGELKLPRDFVAGLLGKQQRGFSVSTSNHYLRSLKSFAGWLTERGRLPRDPLAQLAALNAKVDPRRRRRSIEGDKFDALIDILDTAPAVHSLAGPDRLALYLVASNTGFRAHECSTLLPESFKVDAPPFTVRLPASISKRRQDDGLPLSQSLAELLRLYLANKPAGRPLWPGKWYRKAAAMLRHDLARAGIPYEEKGKVFDFHALRKQFMTAMAIAGFHPKLAQVLGRLSSINLVMDHYTDADGLNAAGMMDKLPPVRGTSAKPKTDPPATP